LIGAPPGYVGFDQGGLLTDGVDQNPHCVLLLDEIEKAHPDLFNILLQVMDHGKLTDHNGKSIDFRNVILIMTTNAGAADMAKSAFGFTRSKREGDDSEAINKLFTPEFRNRLDSIIAFGHLPPEVVRMVVQKFVLQLEAQLDERQINIELSDEAADWLAREGYDEQMGARPLSRVIQRYIKQPLADEVLFGKLSNGGTVRILLGKDNEGLDELKFTYLSPNQEKTLPKPVERKALPATKKAAKPRTKPKPSPASKAGSKKKPGGDTKGKPAKVK
ncbi:MAG: AAA family ATPase, partial [Anderseniella sp.]